MGRLTRDSFPIENCMSLFKIKICGIRFVPDLIVAVDAGADAVGLNFYSPSVRSVSIEQAWQLTDTLLDRENPWDGQVVGVFVNHSAEEIAATVAAVGLNAIQLHGDERPNFIAELQIELMRLSLDREMPIIRAVRIAKDLELGAGEEELNREVALWKAAGASMILLDADVPGAFGGTGHRLDWHSVGRVQLPLPVVLAGGLNAENVADAIFIAKTDAVDVASGVENEQQRKDAALIRQFVSSAKNAFEQVD